MNEKSSLGRHKKTFHWLWLLFYLIKKIIIIMKRLLALAWVLVLYCILCSQTIGPNGQIYDRHCTVGDQFYTEAEAWFNDPDGDCISTDYYNRVVSI